MNDYDANLLVWVTAPILGVSITAFQIAHHYLPINPVAVAISAMVITMAVVVVAQIVKGPAEVAAA